MSKPTLAMILCAGYGKRLNELSQVRPKPAMELHNKPIIFHIIKNLEKAGVKDIIINLHYKAPELKSLVESFDVKATIHCVYEPEILGTAGGVRNALNRLGFDSQKMFVIHGDIWLNADLASLASKDGFVTLLGALGHSAAGYQGGLGINRQAQVVELGPFFKKEAPHVSGFFTGVHVLSKPAIELLRNEAGSCLVSEVYPSWLAAGIQIDAQVEAMDYEDLGTCERLYWANMKLFDSPSAANANHTQAAVVGTNLISPSAILDSDCEVGPRCIIGDGAHIKRRAVVKNSVIFSGTTIEEHERLDGVVALSDVRIHILQ